jgi:hypothetical protein
MTLMLLFMDGFDYYASGDLTEKWSTLGTGTAPTLVAAAARTGAQGLRASLSSAQTAAPLGIVVAPATPATGICGFAIRLSSGSMANVHANNGLFQVQYGGAMQWWLRVNTDGTLTAYRGSALSTLTNLLGTTSAALSSSGWTHVEVKWTLSTTTGSIDVRFNGTPVLTLSGINNQNAATANWGTILFAEHRSGTAFAFDHDDFYLCDASGSAYNDFLGDRRVDAHWPTANGTNSGWTRSTGADQYATVDDAVPNDDTDYNAATAVGTTDTLNFPNLTNAGATEIAVQVCATAKKTAAGGGAITPIVRHSGLDYPGPAAWNLSTSYAQARFVLDTNPGTGLAWTEAGFNAAEIGYRKTS